MAAPPLFPRTACCSLLPRQSPYILPRQRPAHVDGDLLGPMINVFYRLRYLTICLNRHDRNTDAFDLMAFSKLRSTLQHDILSMQIWGPRLLANRADLHLQCCRLGALIYLKAALHDFKPVCAVLRNLKNQLKELISKSQLTCPGCLDLRFWRGTFTWLLFMGGLCSLDDDDVDFFAQYLAHTMRAWHGHKKWADIEANLKEIAWADCLHSANCSALWKRCGEFLGKDLGPVERSSQLVHHRNSTQAMQIEAGPEIYSNLLK